MSGRLRVTATTIAVLVIVFASGVTVGRAWDVRSAEAEVSRTDASGDEDRRDEGGERPRRQPMYEQVGLTDSQQVVIDSLVVHYRTDMRAYQREARARYEAGTDSLVQAVREAILSVMTPAQAAEYRSLLEAADERRREWREEREGNRDDD